MTRGRRETIDLARRGYTGLIGTLSRLIICALFAMVFVVATPTAQTPPNPAPGTTETALDEAFRLYFSGQYDEAAAQAAALRPTAAEALATYELRASALHFRLKRELSAAKDKKAALKACAPCAGLLKDLTTEIAAGRALARERLQKDEGDLTARFYLGKIDLTHVWLHLETLGQRTGWTEYWEARKSLDHVIERQPTHVRALTSRAWIDYIVDTRVPRGVQWLLGGGDRKRALEAARKAAAQPDAGRYSRVEAQFALWEMLTRDKQRDAAVVVARVLSAEFPENKELARFIEGP